MQEIIILIVVAIVIAAVGFWTGLCWSQRAWADLQDELKVQKTLNEAMSKGIELRDAQIEQKDRFIKYLKYTQEGLEVKINQLKKLTRLPQ